MILVIDFDGTIVTGSAKLNDWDIIHFLKPNAKEVINQLYDEGHRIIINTCRFGRGEGECQEFLDREEIKYHYINANLPEIVAPYKGDCRKIYGDIYIDDKNLGGIPNDWLEIYDIIKLKQLEKDGKEFAL